MNYEYLDMGAYHLHFIKTKKFKTITVEVNFRRKIKKEEITIRNLLKAVLLTTNKNFKTEIRTLKRYIWSVWRRFKECYRRSFQEGYKSN